MMLFLLGCAALVVLMGALGQFSSARISTVKSFGVWLAAIGGLLLAVLMLVTGRGATAVSALLLLGPLVWSWLGPVRGQAVPPPPGARPSPGAGAMSHEEALAVLGLKPGADVAAIRAAHRRLMASAHPDRGGSDWVAARVNQARDVLLG